MVTKIGYGYLAAIGSKAKSMLPKSITSGAVNTAGAVPTAQKMKKFDPNADFLKQQDTNKAFKAMSVV